MPTPESAAFLAKKPKVPPTFDGVDYDDNKALKAAQDAIIREQWVGVMMGRLVREEMNKCYMREGVNHLEKCGHLRGELYGDWNDQQLWPVVYGISNSSLLTRHPERYLQLLEKEKVRGYLFEQQNYIHPQQLKLSNKKKE
jgi:hypothetical protein